MGNSRSSTSTSSARTQAEHGRSHEAGPLQRTTLIADQKGSEWAPKRSLGQLRRMIQTNSPTRKSERQAERRGGISGATETDDRIRESRAASSLSAELELGDSPKRRGENNSASQNFTQTTSIVECRESCQVASTSGQPDGRLRGQVLEEQSCQPKSIELDSQQRGQVGICRDSFHEQQLRIGSQSCAQDCLAERCQRISSHGGSMHAVDASLMPPGDAAAPEEEEAAAINDARFGGHAASAQAARVGHQQANSWLESKARKREARSVWGSGRSTNWTLAEGAPSGETGGNADRHLERDELRLGQEGAQRPIVSSLVGVAHSVHETVSQTLSQTVSQTVSQTGSQTVAQTVAQPLSQTVVQTVSQSQSPSQPLARLRPASAVRALTPELYIDERPRVEQEELFCPRECGPHDELQTLEQVAAAAITRSRLDVVSAGSSPLAGVWLLFEENGEQKSGQKSGPKSAGQKSSRKAAREEHNKLGRLGAALAPIGTNGNARLAANERETMTYGIVSGPIGDTIVRSKGEHFRPPDLPQTTSGSEGNQIFPRQLKAGHTWSENSRACQRECTRRGRGAQLAAGAAESPNVDLPRRDSPASQSPIGQSTSRLDNGHQEDLGETFSFVQASPDGIRRPEGGCVSSFGGDNSIMDAKTPSDQDGVFRDGKQACLSAKRALNRGTTRGKPQYARRAACREAQMSSWGAENASFTGAAEGCNSLQRVASGASRKCRPAGQKSGAKLGHSQAAPEPKAEPKAEPKGEPKGEPNAAQSSASKRRKAAEGPETCLSRLAGGTVGKISPRLQRQRLNCANLGGQILSVSNGLDKFALRNSAEIDRRLWVSNWLELQPFGIGLSQPATPKDSPEERPFEAFESELSGQSSIQSTILRANQSDMNEYLACKQAQMDRLKVSSARVWKYSAVRGRSEYLELISGLFLDGFWTVSRLFLD